LESVKAEATFEKLPKNVLAEIFCKLKSKDLAAIWRLNKYFFKLLFDSPCSTILWKNQSISYFELEPEKLEEELSNLDRKQFSAWEQHLNKYCLFFKYYRILTWDPLKKGSFIRLDDDDLAAHTGEPFQSSWNVVLSNKSFSRGVHYVEVEIVKMDGSHFIFLGCGISQVKYGECCFASNFDSWVAGYDSRGPDLIVGANNPRWIQGSRVSILLDLHSAKSPRLGYFVNGKWNGWSFDLKSSATETLNPTINPLYLMICIAHFISIKIQKYACGIHSIQHYLDHNFPLHSFDLQKTLEK